MFIYTIKKVLRCPLVLSKDSIQSNWVKAELKAAQYKELNEGRDVLCPIAIDDSWKEKIDEDVLWQQMAQKNIIDFSAWNSGSFNSQFNKLVKGMKINYTVKRE